MRALLLVAALCATAHADNASALFDQGQARYEAGDYRGAIALFQEAYGLARDPVYLFNLGQAYRKLFDCVRATEYYQRYLAEATDADDAQRDKVRQLVHELAPCVDERHREVEAARSEVEARLHRPPPPPPPPQPRFVEHDSGRWYRIAGYATAGVGVVALGFAGYETAHSSELSSELHRACANGCDWTAALAVKDRAGTRANHLATAGWIAGGAALAGGVVLYVVGRSKPIERIQITPTAGGATVGASLRF